VIDLKREIERELSQTNPPDLWDRIQADASDDGDAKVLHLGVAQRRRRPLVPLAVAAIAALVAMVGASRLLDDDTAIDTVPAQTGGAESTTIARGVVEFVEQPSPDGCCVPPGGGLPYPAGQGLGGQTMEIAAEVEGGEVTGEARFALRPLYESDPVGFPISVDFECADTQTDDVVLGGTVTAQSDSANPSVGALMAVIIREGEPDSATVWWDDGMASSCQELLAAVPQPRPDDAFVEVIDGHDIETGG
jgi:hypothetical protein